MSRSKFNGAVAQAKTIAAWPVAVRLQQFGYQEISREMTSSMELATFIVRGWLATGKIRQISPERKGGSGRIVFEIVPEHEIRIIPVAGDIYEQMWTTMRKSGAFSPVDLQATNAAGVSLDDAATYCRLLVNTGYLRVVQKAAPPNRPAIYRISDASGVAAPRMRRVACIVDPNRGTILPLSEFSQ